MLHICKNIFYNNRKNNRVVHVVCYDNFTYVHDMAICWQDRCVTYLIFQGSSWAPLFVHSLPFYYYCIKSSHTQCFTLQYKIWGPQIGIMLVSFPSLV